MSRLGNIGKYELRRQIGRGAMGLVYEAFDTVIERRVALKMLRTEVFPAEQLPEVRARLKREAHSAGKLSHRNIVTIFDYGEQRVNRPSGAGHALRRLDPFADRGCAAPRTVLGISDHCNLGPSAEPAPRIIEAYAFLTR